MMMGIWQKCILQRRSHAWKCQCMVGKQSILGFRLNDGAMSIFAAPVSPVSPALDSRRLEKSFSLSRSRLGSMRSSESAKESIEELKILLEAYFVVIDNTYNKLTSELLSSYASNYKCKTSMD
ncbi:magnesium transporter MRS2-1-like isoform X2 [Spinacia oleracea]|uniref:Magnesium transporter MRS2-1-like isoform X2 n=1 Tax=Spinacia oleracea TaxID=3562 RepID=A0ABM3QSJ0_SPIOL|nr:magnesium transporter MRS2-1-like isoform X2 [Spinacia oleracea]